MRQGKTARGAVREAAKLTRAPFGFDSKAPGVALNGAKCPIDADPLDRGSPPAPVRTGRGDDPISGDDSSGHMRNQGQKQ
jgi:hypothetical protein